MKLTFRKLCYVALLLCAVVSSSHAATKSSNRKPARTAPHKTAITPAALHGKVLFARDGNLWIVDPNTRREQLLLKNPFGGEPWTPYSTGIAVNPDLKSIVLEHTPKGDFTGSELWLVNLSSKSVKRLTDTNAMQYATEPQFSPDGKQISYTRRSGRRMGGPGYTGMEIRLINADGSKDRKVIGNVGDVSQSYFGAFWSRDGKRLMFTHYIGNVDYADEGRNKRELQTCAIDGTDVQPFDGNYSAFARPDVSPDGKYRAVVAPISPSYSKYPDLRLFTSQNRFVRDLTSFKRDLTLSSPYWSRDSGQVVFDVLQLHTSVDKEGYAHEVRVRGVWSIHTNGEKLRRIVANAALITVLP